MPSSSSHFITQLTTLQTIKAPHPSLPMDRPCLPDQLLHPEISATSGIRGWRDDERGRKSTSVNGVGAETNLGTQRGGHAGGIDASEGFVFV